VQCAVRRSYTFVVQDMVYTCVTLSCSLFTLHWFDLQCSGFQKDLLMEPRNKPRHA